MNPARYEAIVKNQSAIAQKVLAAIPISSPWSISQIVAELARHIGRPDQRVIDGCIRHLIDVGLVKEGPMRHYQRIYVHKDETKMPAPSLTAVKTEKSPIFTRLTDLASSFRKLADELDDIALDAEEEISKGGKEAQQLRQLKTLLKDL